MTRTTRTKTGSAPRSAVLVALVRANAHVLPRSSPLSCVCVCVCVRVRVRTRVIIINEYIRIHRLFGWSVFLWLGR